MSLETALAIAHKRSYSIEEHGAGDFHIVIAACESYKAYLFELKQYGFKLLSDVFGIDYLEYTEFKPERFAVVYNLYQLATQERLFVKVYLADGATLPTVTDLWRTANFHEREVFDLFGIEFEGHPDLRKILTPEDLDAFPLRKDFPLGESPTLFREGRFLDPAAFRAGLSGKDGGLSGWRGGARNDSRREGRLPGPSKENGGVS
jgi:NADH-quinone oxidoreductase subunit C